MEQDNKKAQTSEQVINDVTQGDYKYGFVTDIDTDIIPVGLNEDVVRLRI